MASVPNLNGSVVAANNQNVAALVNFNLDVSLVRWTPPEEFSTIGPSLSLIRRNEAEYGQQHKLACRLGFLFNDIIPATPKLIKAFGTRVSDILRRPGVNPQGSEEDGPFKDFVGADGTSIWAAATSMSASLSVYLLACMLARAWDAKQATAIWVELVHERISQIQAETKQNPAVNPYTQAAAMQDFNRPDLARWDASARSWLRRADQCTVLQHTQFKLIIDNIRLPFLDSGTTFDKVTRAWIRAMEVLETLLGNEPQVAFDRSVLLAVSSWHLYPNLLVFQEHATNVSFSDELFPSLGVLSLGFEYHAPKSDAQNKKPQDTGMGTATRWSLALSHLRYYGSPVQIRSDESQGERATIDEIWLTCLGAILRQWEVSISNLEPSVQWFTRIGDLLHPTEESEKTVLSWFSKLCRVASTISNQDHTQRQDRMRFVRFGWRKDTRLLGSQKVLRPPFFGLCNPDVLGSLSKHDGTEIGFEFFRRVAQRLSLLPEHAIICRSKEYDNLTEAWEWATISPVPAGSIGSSDSDQDGSTLLRNARWLSAEDREGHTIRSDEMRQRQTSIHRLGEHCHIIIDPKDIPHKKKATWDSRDSRDSGIVPAGLRFWESPPPLFAEDGRFTQFVELQYIPMPDTSAGFHMFVLKELYEHRLKELKSQMDRAAMEVDVQAGLKWLQNEGMSFDIVGFLMGFVEGKQYSFLHGRGRNAGKKRKRSPDIEADAKSHHADLLASDNGRHLGAYYTVGLYRKIPTEWIASLRALEIVSELYSQLPGATISLRLIDQELFKAKWFPRPSSEMGDSFGAISTASVKTLCNRMTRARSFACIAMMESGQSNIDIEHTEAVVALCSENSIFVAGILLSDPTTANLGMNIRHLIGNVGHAGIVLMVSPSDPSTRAPTYDASMIDHNLYDGKHIDSFEGTSLHLSFTKWEMPLEWDNTGDIDQQVFLLESVISVQDKGRWVADLDVLALENDGCDILQFPCDCDRTQPPTDKDIASLDSWEELLDAPPSVGVIRASDNWVARLCAAAILIRKGQGHCVVVTADEPICWTCMAEHYAYPESHLPQFIIN